MARSRVSLTGRTYVPWFLEVFVISTIWLFYRIRSSGAEKVPKEGGALLVANHLSYIDVLVLQVACPRPIRFVGYSGFENHWFIGWIYRLAGVIGISPERPMEGMRDAIRALEAGELVCVFGEGGISRTGQLLEVKKGYEIMARRAQVPVVPAAIDGVWGSVFSFAGNSYLWKSPRLMPTPVFIAFGAPLPPEAANRTALRRALMDLGAAAFDERPSLKRHLGRETVRALAKRPSHRQVVDRTGERRVVRSGELLAAAAALSRHLRQTVPGRRVGIVLPPGAGAFIANLAVVCAGKIPVNLNFTAGRAALESSLRIAEIGTVLTANALKPKVAHFPWPGDTRDLREEIAAAGGKRAVLPWLVAAWILPNQWYPALLGLPRTGDRGEAALLFTSGSSGEPKGVILTHRNLLANCAQVSSLSILPDDAILVGCLPVFHSFGFTITLWYPLLRGCRLVTIPSPLETRKIIDAIKEEEATVMLGAPTFIRPFLKKATSAELRSLHLVVTGAERLPPDLYEKFQQQFHIEILQGYGLTETAPAACLNQPDPILEGTDVQLGKRTGSVGRLLPGMTARIVDPDTGEDRPITETGLILFRGANVFTGYLGNPERTSTALRDGWFVSGDIGRFDDEGFLFIEGRQSRFSKIAGEMVPHGTVEQRIVEAFGWQDSETPVAVVVGVPDADKGEAIVLLTTADVSQEQLRQKLQEAGVPALWIPRVVRRVDRIPMLGTGKVDFAGCLAAATKS